MIEEDPARAGDDALANSNSVGARQNGDDAKNAISAATVAALAVGAAALIGFGLRQLMAKKKPSGGSSGLPPSSVRLQQIATAVRAMRVRPPPDLVHTRMPTENPVKESYLLGNSEVRTLDIRAKSMLIPTPVAGYPGGYEQWAYCKFVASEAADREAIIVDESPTFRITSGEMAGNIVKTGDREFYVAQIYQHLVANGWHHFHTGRFWYSLAFFKLPASPA